MKKTIKTLIAMMTIFLLAACGNDNKTSTAQTEINDSLEILNTVWASYADDEKFAVAGGDYTEENQTMEGAGRFSLEDAEAIDSMLAFPKDSIDQIDDAASIMHMMNANTFTCGAYHVKDSRNIDELTSLIRDNIMNRQWVCGFPDKLVVVKLEDYIVAMFGKNEFVDTFQTKLADAYQGAEVVYDLAIE